MNDDDLVFKALADATRRLLLDRLFLRDGRTLSDLATAVEMTRFGVMKHLRVLEEAVLAFKGCVLVVSHDRYFLDRVCDRIIAFEGHGRISQCAGNYSYYQDKRAPLAAAEMALANASAKKPKTAAAAPAPVEKARKMSMKEQRELADLEPVIANLEKSIAALEGELANPDFFAKLGAGLNDHLKQIEKKKAELDKQFTRWAELEEIRVAAQ